MQVSWAFTWLDFAVLYRSTTCVVVAVVTLYGCGFLEAGVVVAVGTIIFVQYRFVNKCLFARY